MKSNVEGLTYVTEDVVIDVVCFPDIELFMNEDNELVEPKFAKTR